MAFDPICPRCGSEAVMEPGSLKGRQVGSGLDLECVACHYRAPNLRFAARNSQIEIENRLERIARIAKAKPVSFPGVNGMAVCDCGNTTFSVGCERDDIGNNHIRCLECSECGHHLAVPFFHDS